MSERKYVKIFEEFVNEKVSKETIKYLFKKDDEKVLLIGRYAGKEDDFIKNLKKELMDNKLFNGANYGRNKYSKEQMTTFEIDGDKKEVEKIIKKVAKDVGVDVTSDFDKSEHGVKENFVNEGLGEFIFIPKNKEHGKKAKEAIDDSDLYAEYNERENYLSFGEEENPNALEMEVQNLFDEWGVEGHFELQK